jgi:predicted MPP superfamily phosphohydrolase
MVLTSLILWAILGLIAAFLYYVHQIEPRRLQTEHVQIRVRRLPGELAGLKIAHLSDLHLQNSRHAMEMGQQAVALATAHSPDLVCITGDMAHRSEHAALACHTLAGLEAIHGVYAVLGNHDMDESLELDLLARRDERVSVREWMSYAENAGISLLANRHQLVKICGRNVVLVGVGDPSCGYDDLQAALADAPRGDLHILLSHSPDIFDDPLAEWADLILCGHTHGGQLRLPVIGTPWAPVWRRRDRASGLMRLSNDTVAYVNRGVGSGTRARLNCPPEVAMLELATGFDEGLSVVK